MAETQLAVLIVSPSINIIFVINDNSVIISATHNPRMEFARTLGLSRFVVLLEILDSSRELVDVIRTPIVYAEVISYRGGEA